MANINDFHPALLLVNDFKSSKDGPILFKMAYGEENNMSYIIFNNT